VAIHTYLYLTQRNIQIHLDDLARLLDDPGGSTGFLRGRPRFPLAPAAGAEGKTGQRLTQECQAVKSPGPGLLTGQAQGRHDWDQAGLWNVPQSRPGAGGGRGLPCFFGAGTE